jgi:NADH-quinone oxidoreductase subunit M
MAAFASIGLPGFGNFASEIMVFFGAFGQGQPTFPFSTMQLATVLALWGVVISAVYMLRAYRSVFFGEPGEAVATWVAVPAAQRWCIILLVAVLMVAGFAPNYFLSYITPTLRALLP